jgi:hypothetical protein
VAVAIGLTTQKSIKSLKRCSLIVGSDEADCEWCWKESRITCVVGDLERVVSAENVWLEVNTRSNM